MLKNEVKLDGVRNARQLGGFPVGTKVVKKGVLIRTGTLEHAKEDAIRVLSERYHVQAIIDLRMSGESRKAPDPEVPGAKNIRLPIVEFEDYITKLGDPELARHYLSQNMSRDEMIEVALKHGLIGPEVYPFFLMGERGKKAYHEFFQTLLASDPKNGAILWHCTDGKDRAGLASALLLAALGASKETILEDYLLTNEYHAPMLEKVRERLASAEITPERMDVLLFVAGGAIENYLLRAFEGMDKEFGGINGYLSEALKLTKSDIGELRKKYTEDYV
ncbi:MAG: tyrosine-protein phosphatase [Lachnospiraceae bacterium]|jgi:protein-tyrosine phosphatase|nr:tyrosine-protein phosphatase [Lachnospiraceae bacterium]